MVDGGEIVLVFDQKDNENTEDNNNIKDIANVELHESRTKQAPKQCDQCGRVVFSSLSRHMLTHSELKQYQCLVCSEAFVLKEDLTRHNDFFHAGEFDGLEREADIDEETVSCIDPEELLEFDGLEKEAVNEETVSCIDPQELGGFEEELMEESLFHQQPSNTNSSLTSTSRPSLITAVPQNKKIHVSGKNIYKCDQCSKAFSALYRLRSHQITHSRVKNYSCPVCLKSFYHKGSIMRHLRTLHKMVDIDANSGPGPSEEDKKRYKCDQCGKCFKGKKSYYDHRGMMHPDAPHFLCDTCGCAFLYEHQLQVHMMSHNCPKKPFPCPFCEKAYKRFRFLKDHLKLHAVEEELLEGNSEAPEGHVFTQGNDENVIQVGEEFQTAPNDAFIKEKLQYTGKLLFTVLLILIFFLPNF